MKHSFFWAFFLVKHCLTMIDVNIHELQYVSDHLTHQQCRQLSAALRSDSWNLPQNISARGEPIAPCLMLLLRYDMEEGRDKTHHELSRRIQQIGRMDLAMRFSKMVRHKKAEAIRMDFLDDPFKEEIGMTPFFLDDSPEKDDVDIVGKDENKDDIEKMDDNEEDSVTAEVMEDKSSKNLKELLPGISNLNITLIYATVFVIFLLLMTFCICGCPQSIKKCFKSSTPCPLIECLSDVSTFIRVDLAGYVKDVYPKKSASELNAASEMRQKLLLR